MTTIAVRGESVREVEPELAEFSVSVAARGKDRPAALARLRERSDALRQLLDRYADAIERRETTGLHVHPENARRGERVTAYTGRVSTTVVVKDFVALGEMMLTIANQDQTDVYGPSWSLRPDSPVHREARQAAVGEAIARAREYAETLGAEIAELLELSDPGLNHGPEPFAFQAYGAAQVSRGSELQLDPQPQRVTAAVEARFTITRPTLL